MPTNTIDAAMSLLRIGEAAIVLNTDGQLLDFRGGVPVRSGIWKVSIHRIRSLGITKVIIYHRDPDRTIQHNDVFIADYVGVEPARPAGGYGAGRFVINMKDARLAGLTRLNWREFADTYQNPVRYLRREG